MGIQMGGRRGRGEEWKGEGGKEGVGLVDRGGLDGGGYEAVVEGGGS